MASENPTIHATAVLTGPKAMLIRGPAGAGKSRLAWDVIEAAGGALPFARLVADDRVFVEAHAGRLLVRPVAELAGMLEIRGLGIRRLPYETLAVVGLVVDLAAADAARLPPQAAGTAELSGVTLPRLTVASGMPALPLVLAALRTPPMDD
ncbi:MAG TPA: HPr kinase/phosphatase C-terminal domain-containing protein [Pseudolabrys sp.]|jgi:serine kinase of HPr protein (carbohydrate metabolism regulator)|nr:HPr kinase/phosphatase C-terminal domain-containing protein [Pseudolabrys sp.]